MIYFVATPIGNLNDISLRALETLKNVQVIACEDTRTSKVLLDKFEIKNKLLISYHKFNEQESSQNIIKLASEGKDIAVISDAGMPGISDPGNILAKKLVEAKIDFTVIPGASALTTALVLSGFDSRNFFFAGFLPEKKVEKDKLLSQISTLSSTLIFYVSSHNIKKDIQYLFEQLGNRKACLVKELTKVFETKYYFSLLSLPEIDERGEFVLIVEGSNESLDFDSMTIQEHVLFYVNLGFSKNDAIKKVAKERGKSKNEIYMQVLNI
ncbi:MAG: 16S rRNA (cytidine(1402)-2'-O)-methyltransferase [Firmicutes bacterium]|nr:16S rRNA (cytidine(1402)-2'-O)-methyltransferase [Bacillota bacterium]MDY5586277.1 16S rRNA (cytidine(1402)-2'-O)-methyltransferase [Eubacteriales bacterium]